MVKYSQKGHMHFKILEERRKEKEKVVVEEEEEENCGLEEIIYKYESRT